MIAEIALLVILGGVSFHLRGVWGHHIGGALMGSIFGFGLGIAYDLDLVTSIVLAFWLALVWALASMVGWANHGGWSRFVRGYLAYGMLPNLIIGQIIFPGNFSILIQLITIGSLGMGIGFGLSSPLLKTFRARIKQNYDKTKETDKELIFNQINSETEISHVYQVNFNTWTYLMEVPSGALYGLTTALVLSLQSLNINPDPRTLGLSHSIYIFIIFGVLLFAAFFGGYKHRKRKNPFLLDDKGRWSASRFKRVSVLTLIILLILGLSISIFVQSLKVETLFLILLWITIFSARIKHELDATMFQIDMIFDIICGIIVSGLIYAL